LVSALSVVISLFLVLVDQQGGFEMSGEEVGGLIISTHAAAFGCDFCEWPLHGGETWVVAFPARGFFSRWMWGTSRRS
jgi:hypothetical protein